MEVRTSSFSVVGLGAAGSPTKPAGRREGEPKGEKVKVFVRVRPCQADETPGVLRLSADGSSVTAYREDGFLATEFAFDSVLSPDASQADVYTAAVQPVVADVLRGYNATLLAYGSSGSGKTYTLGSINPEAVGMIPRAAAEIFAAVAANPTHYTVQLSYVQIYCEQVQDLLRPASGDNLAIREGESGPCVVGLSQVEVHSLDDCLRLLQLGERNRTAAFTALNAHSSRSHAVVMLTVVQRSGVATRRGIAAAQRVRVGTLFMVDLAGSERLKKSRSTGQRASEAKAINLSLTTLGMCINARAENSKHVPFRDSKLTRLLQESLGGNAKTSLIVAVSDAVQHAEETVQSLGFGTRAMHVVTRARVNEQVDPGSRSAMHGAALGVADDQRAALERSLLERVGEVEHLGAQLAAERKRSSEVVRALEAERQTAQEQARALIEAHATRMQAEEQHRLTLQEQLEAQKEQAEEASAHHERARLALLAAAEEQRRAAQAAHHRAQTLEQRHDERLGQLLQQLRVEKEKVQRAHVEETAALQQQIRNLHDRLEASQATEQATQAAHAIALDRLRSTLEARLREVAAAAQRQQQEAVGKDEELAELRGAVKNRDLKLAQAKGLVKKMEMALSAAAERVLRAEAHASQQEQAQQDMVAALFQRRRMHNAARCIQRAYREHRMRQLTQQRSEGIAALHEAQHALGSLAQQHAELERRRHANLAFAGQTLVGDSLGVLSEAVESLVSTFLLPARELKTLHKYRHNHKAPGGVAAAVREQGAITAEGVLVTPTQPSSQALRVPAESRDFIRAFKPTSATSTGPRRSPLVQQIGALTKAAGSLTNM